MNFTRLRDGAANAPLMISWCRLFSVLMAVSLVGWWLFSVLSPDGIRDDFVRTDPYLIHSAVRAFKEEFHHYPSEVEGLSALTKPPLSLSSDLLLDLWGNPYQLRLDPKLEDGMGIYSFGADGVSFSKGDDPDDPNTWDHGKVLPGRWKPESKGSILLKLLLGSGVAAAIWKWLHHPTPGTITES